MHITILALGSRGDVLPYATLGQELCAAGNQVRFATFESFRDLVVASGFDFCPIRGDAQVILSSGPGQAMVDSGRSVVRMATGVKRSFGALAQAYVQDLSALGGAETDLILCQLPGGLYGYDLAEKLGVPLALTSVIPLVPSRARPMLAFPAALAPLPGYNLLSHWLAYQIVWQGFRPVINRWRRETLGLGNAPFWGPFPDTYRCTPVLNGFSAHVVPRPPDWGDHIHVTGYWFSRDEAWRPPDELRRFIEAGPPPVFVGFGSMPLRDAGRVTAVVLEALQLSGQRGVLGAGWSSMGQRALPDHALAVDYAAYGWLFPRMAAVVHHGGSGTTGWALRAGVPSLVVPFLFDQFYWGRRIAALGVGPEPIPFKKLAAQRLATAIRTAVDDDGLRRRAAALGAKIAAEDGLGTAVELIRGIVRPGSGVSAEQDAQTS